MTEPQRTIPDIDHDLDHDLDEFSEDLDADGVILDFQPEEELDSLSQSPIPVATGPLPMPGRLRDPNRRLGRTGPLWFTLGAIGVIVIFFIVLSLRGPRESGPALQATSGAPGGIAGPPAVTTVPTDTPVPPTPTPVPVLQPEQKVFVANTDGQGIRLRAEPNIDGVTLEIYKDGEEFTVLEPGEPYDSYPIEQDGYQWYRIRDKDGLVGWTVSTYLQPVR